MAYCNELVAMTALICANWWKVAVYVVNKYIVVYENQVIPSDQVKCLHMTLRSVFTIAITEKLYSVRCIDYDFNWHYDLNMCLWHNRLKRMSISKQ